MKVYFISGLAADSRVFKHIRLPIGYDAVYLDWITPLKNESLTSYSLRLAEKINIKEEFALIGLSMGGMIAIEIAKRYPPNTTILLSSIPVSGQLPSPYKVAHFLRIQMIIPPRLLKSLSIIKRYFSDETIEDKIMLRQVIRECNPSFIRWAITAILKWRNDKIPQPMWHIHGNKDVILPIRYTKPTHVISNGTHLMVMSKANELNKLLEEALFASKDEVVKSRV